MNLDSIRIVLVATSHPGNIGAAARAMKTMGLKHLYLVTPKLFPDWRAVEMAAGADDVLDLAIISNSLEDAIQDCQLVLATSARPRDISLPGLIPSSAAELIYQQPDETKIAIVFGREHAGLTNNELLCCNYHVNIPSNPDYSSLNLAQAVQILAYELRMRLLSPSPSVETTKNTSATMGEVEKLYAHLQTVLIAIDFLKPSNPRLMPRIRRMINRLRIEHLEVNILRGILSQIEASLNTEKINYRSIDKDE